MTQYSKKKGVRRLSVMLNGIKFNIAIDQTNDWITVERDDDKVIEASNLNIGKKDDSIYSGEVSRIWINRVAN